MNVKLVNQTNYANIYGLYDENNKQIGIKEVVLAGCNTGTYYSSISSKTKKEIKKLFAACENKNN